MAARNLFEDELPFDSGSKEDDDDVVIDYVDPANEDKIINNNTTNTMNWSTPSYQSPWTGPTQQSSGPSSPFSGGFGNTTQNTTNYGSTPFYQPKPQQNNNNNKLLPREKKIIICDFLDNIVENYQGCPGVEPRGSYDLRPKFDFWYKMKYISPDYVIVCTNQNFETGSIQSEIFSTTTKYFLNGLAQFIEVPIQNCFCLCKSGFDKRDSRVKPNPGLVLDALKMIHWKENGYTTKDIIIVGYNSGYPGQSDKDLKMAKSLGIDYIDIPQLLEHYV